MTRVSCVRHDTGSGVPRGRLVFATADALLCHVSLDCYVLPCADELSSDCSRDHSGPRTPRAHVVSDPGLYRYDFGAFALSTTCLEVVQYVSAIGCAQSRGSIYTSSRSAA